MDVVEAVQTRLHKPYTYYVVTFEEIMTSGFYLFILYIYFAFVECICFTNGAYCPLRVPFKNRVTKTQPCIRWRFT